MKKIFFTLFALSIEFSSIAQSIKILNGNTDVTNNTVTVPVQNGSASHLDLELHNSTSSSITFNVNRSILNTPFPTCGDLYYCTIQTCFSPSTATLFPVNYTSNTDGSIAANSSLPSGNLYGISAYYDVCANQCYNLQVKFRVFRTDIANDTAFVIVNYVCNSTGINETNSDNSMKIYPTPANEEVHFTLHSISNNQELTILNSNGQCIYKSKPSDTNITIPTLDWEEGIYLAIFENQIQKIVIAR
jgi:hypothetical protein